MSYEFAPFAPQGWQCPLCRRVYSPNTPMCWYCGNGKQTTITSTGTNINPGYMPPVNEWGKTSSGENYLKDYTINTTEDKGK